MADNKQNIDEILAKRQHEIEKINRELDEARAKEEETKENPPLAFDEVVKQMGTGRINYRDKVIKFRAVQLFHNSVSLPIPIEYLKVNSQDEEVVSFLNNDKGISLTIQFTKSERKHVTFEQVKNGMDAQFKNAGIYAEMIEEGKVEDDVAPLYFIAQRIPLAPGVMYQMTFYAINKINAKMIIGSYNCFYKDLDVWGNIIKATLTYLDFH